LIEKSAELEFCNKTFFNDSLFVDYGLKMYFLFLYF